jgi:hypothetical protein
MFVIDPNKRIAMSEVKSAMSEIFEKCSISSDYYRKGVPRTDLNVDAGSLKFARTSPEDYSTSPSISSSCICSDTCNASSSFEQLTELFGVTSEVDEDARQPQIISDSTTPVPRLPALIHALDDIDDKLRQNYQQTETSPLQDSVSPASLAEIQAAAVKSSLKASSSPSRLPIPVPTTVGTSYLQTSSDVSSIRRRPHSSTSNTDPSFVDQEDPLWLPTGEFLGAHNRSQNRLDYDSLFNMSETDIRNTDTTSNAAVERNEDRMSTVRPVSSANAEDLNASNSGRTRESRGWKQKIGIRIHKLSEYVRWHHISEKVRGWKY